MSNQRREPTAEEVTEAEDVSGWSWGAIFRRTLTLVMERNDLRAERDEAYRKGRHDIRAAMKGVLDCIDEATDLKAELTKANERANMTQGWWYAQACSMVDGRVDIRLVEFPELVALCDADLAEPTTPSDAPDETHSCHLCADDETPGGDCACDDNVICEQHAPTVAEWTAAEKLLDEVITPAFGVPPDEAPEAEDRAIILHALVMYRCDNTADETPEPCAVCRGYGWVMVRAIGDGVSVPTRYACGACRPSTACKTDDEATP